MNLNQIIYKGYWIDCFKIAHHERFNIIIGGELITTATMIYAKLLIEKDIEKNLINA